nr:NTP transferase domain-containing protein [Chroococcidiopsis sp. SAG 2025]
MPTPNLPLPLPTSLSSIVLAGGKSSRMGRDKALLPVDGVPLLQKVCEVAIALCDRVYVVTPWQERYQHLLPVGCEFIREQGGEQGAGDRGQGDKGTRGTRKQF